MTVRPSRAAVASASAVFMVMLFMSQPVFASSSSQGGTTQWTLVSAPTQATVGSLTEISATYTMHYNSTTPVLGIAVAALRNAQGQTVYISSGTTALSFNQQGTIYITVTGAPPGSYTATVFVMDTAGVAVSNSSTLAVTV
jgi:hypothetical protein